MPYTLLLWKCNIRAEMGCAAFSPLRFTGLNPPFVGLCKAFQINTFPFMAAVSTECPFVNPRVGNNFGIPE